MVKLVCSLRTLIAGTLLVFVFTALPVASSAAGASESEAIQRFGACLAAGGQGRVLLMLDTSGSLEGTDPQNLRIDAANHLVSELTNSVSSTGSSIKIAVAGFSSAFDLELGWTNLTSKNKRKVTASVERFTNKNTDLETDYWMAIDGARKFLNKDAPENACSVLVWFSDGAHDIEHRKNEKQRERYGVTKPYGPDVKLKSQSAADQLEKAGLQDLCRDGGIADQLRTDEATVLAIGLQGQQPSSAFDVMRGIATSHKVGGKPCGGIDGSKQGAFFLAQDFAGLFFAFDAMSDPNHPPMTNETQLCQGTVCDEFAHKFTIDSTISRVKVLGSADVTDFYAVLVSPNGKQTRLEPTKKLSFSDAGFELSGHWRTDAVFSVSIERKQDLGWVGEWRLVFVDPKSTGKGKARSNIRLYSDLEAVWANPERALVIGETPKLTFEVLRNGKSNVDLSSISGSALFDASIEYSTGENIQIASSLRPDELREPLAIDLSSASSGEARLLTTLRLATAGKNGGSGTTLSPKIASYPVTIEPPASYPKVSSRLDFGLVESADPVDATLKVKGDGCVWLENSKTGTLPDGVDFAKVSSAATSADTCASGDLGVTMTPSALGPGLLSGELTVMTKPAEGAGQPLPVKVKYQLEMQRPANTVVRWLVFILLLVLGVLIPLSLLMFIKWVTARIPGPGLAWLEVSGFVGEYESFIENIEPDLGQLTTISINSTNNRKLRLNSGHVLHTGANYQNLSAPGTVVVDATHVAYSTGKTLPLAIQNQWFAVLDETDPHAGDVKVVILLDKNAQKIDKVVSDLRARLAKIVTELRETVPRTGASDQISNQWGTSPDGQTLPPNDEFSW